MVWPDYVEGRNHYFSVEAVDPFAFNIHRLSRDRLARLSGGRTFADSAPSLMADFRGARRVAGHNVDYDIKHLQLEFRRLGQCWGPKSAVCTMKFFSQSVGATDRKGKPKAPRLSELCGYFGVKDGDVLEAVQRYFGVVCQAHDARYDAAATWLCLDAAQKSGQIRGIMR